MGLPNRTNLRMKLDRIHREVEEALNQSFQRTAEYGGNMFDTFANEQMEDALRALRRAQSNLERAREMLESTR